MGGPGSGRHGGGFSRKVYNQYKNQRQRPYSSIKGRAGRRSAINQIKSRIKNDNRR
jgi:hypothetical protein